MAGKFDGPPEPCSYGPEELNLNGIRLLLAAMVEQVEPEARAGNQEALELLECDIVILAANTCREVVRDHLESVWERRRNLYDPRNVIPVRRIT